MRIIPILSSAIIVVGCFMPWIQLGALFTNRGIDNPDGAIMLVAGIIAGGLSLYNYSQEKPKNTWIYLAVGAIGLITAYIDLNEVTARAEKIAESLGELNSVFGGNREISLMNFVGSGLYIVCGGAIGLILSGFGIFKSEQQQHPSPTTIQNNMEFEERSLTKKCPACAETIKKEAKVCRYCQYKFSEEELKMEDAVIEEVIIETEKNELLKLHQLIKSEKNKFIGGGMTDEIQTIMNNLFKTKEKAIYLINEYKTISQSDLVDDLKKLDTSYNSIKRNVSIFIDLDLIEENYPHDRKK